MSKIGFLFPGQGAQAVGMGRALYQESSSTRRLFDRAGELLGFDLAALCFEGPAEALEATDAAQPAIFVASLAALEDLKTREPKLVESCAGAAGLSLGEYSALVFAGALDFDSGLLLVRKRGEAMQAAALALPGGMAGIIGLDESAVDELLLRVAPIGRIWKANLLGPGNIVVSGDRAAVEALEPIAAELGAARVVRLSVAGAFHTPLMEPASRSLNQVLEQTPFNAEARLPVYSNVDARPHEANADRIRAALAAQLTRPVLWEESMRAMLADGFDSFYEIGPGRVLTGLLKRIQRKIPCENVPAR